jgi:hypothetical protein
MGTILAVGLVSPAHALDDRPTCASMRSLCVSRCPAATRRGGAARLHVPVPLRRVQADEGVTELVRWWTGYHGQVLKWLAGALQSGFLTQGPSG